MSWEELPLSRIYYDATRGVPGIVWPIGTPGVPSNTIADVVTILAARNLHEVDIHGAVTLGATMEHHCFFGHYHESVADIVTLGAGNDVDDSHFEGLIITGAQGGTLLATYKECMLLNMTGFRGLAENCAIYGTLAVAVGAGGFADFDRCTSVHGTITVTIGAPNKVSFKEFSGGMILKAQTDGAVLVRGISGYLEVDAMDGGAATLDIYADAADIKINANCLAGTINIFGNARVTGAGGGVTINNYTLDTNLATVDTVVDAVKVSTDKLAGAAPVVGDATEDWNTAEADIVSIGANDTKNKLHSLVLDISGLTATATISIRMYMQVNGVEKKVYDQDFVVGTDPDGLWIVNGTVGIHEVLRVTAQSDNGADDGKTITYDYMLEVM